MTALTVIVVSRSRPDLLRDTLASLGRCRLPEGYEELVVVENGPEQRLREMISGLPPLLRGRYERVESPAKSAALNHALPSVRSGLVVFFDDDVEIGERALLGYAAAAEKYGRRHYFGGPTSARYEQPPPAWLMEFLPVSARGLDRGEKEIVAPDFHFLGFNWAAWKEDIVELGGFNENLGPGAWTDTVGEETEMQRRMIQAGISSVYLPSCRVTHRVSKICCSETWALNRKRRTELAATIVSGSRLLGSGLLPLTASVARLLVKTARSLFSRSPDRRFAPRFEWWAMKGLWRGLRLNGQAAAGRKALSLRAGLPRGRWES